MNEIEPLLRSHRFLKGLDPEHLLTLAASASRALVAPGEFLCREGQPARATYLVRSGRIVLEIDAPPRGAVQVEDVGPDEVIGWSWLLAPYRWHFDARAVEPSEVLVLDGERLRAACDADHHLGYELEKRFLYLVTQRLERLRMQLLDVYAWP